MDKNNSMDIYYYKQNILKINTSELFKMKQEGNYLRIKNKNINCVFKNFTYEIFDKTYNKFYKLLNLDFRPKNINGKIFYLDEDEKELLIQEIITHWIFYYNVNDLKVRILRSDFLHPQTLWIVNSLLEKKYEKENIEIMKFGAKIIRITLKEYQISIKSMKTYIESR